MYQTYTQKQKCKFHHLCDNPLVKEMGELVSEHRDVRQPGGQRAWGDWIGFIQVYVFQEFFAWTVEQMNTLMFIRDLNRICMRPE